MLDDSEIFEEPFVSLGASSCARVVGKMIGAAGSVSGGFENAPILLNFS
jgi:hypothetical protein